MAIGVTGRTGFDHFQGFGWYILNCYKSYMTFTGYHIPTQKEFILNLDEKMNEAEFINDTKDLLVPGESYVPSSAYDLVKEKLIESM